MAISLSDHFTYKKLLRFTLPSIAMMLFTSVYGVVDGFFVSNFVGSTPFAAINLIMPFLMLFGAVGFMVGAGGSALVAAAFGRGDDDYARALFSLLIYMLIALGALCTVLGFLFMRPVSLALGATTDMIEDCVTYGRIIMLSLIPFMLQSVFQSFLVTAEKPRLGLYITLIAGCTNMVLDALFMGVLKGGVAGAAWATFISQCVGGLLPLMYFLGPNKSRLRLGKTRFYTHALLKTCTNGSSEFMSNVAMSVVNMLYNFQLLRLAGEAGVAAYGVIMYVNFIFLSIFFGYAIGSAPIVSFHFGAGNTIELTGLLKKSLRLMFGASLFLTLLAEGLAYPLSHFFVGYDETLCAMTTHGFRLYSLMFLLCGFNIFSSSFFTALGDGLTSALLAFSRVLVYQVAFVLLLPLAFGVDGIWGSVAAAELFAAATSLIFLIVRNRRFHYL